MFNEDFERCAACDHPYFEKKEVYTLSKKDDEGDKRTFIRTKITIFICEACKIEHTPDYETDSSEVYDNLKY